MNILFLPQVLSYPLVGGAKIRAYYILKQLSQRHNVTLVSFVREDDKASDIAHLRSICHEIHTVPLRRSRWKDGRALLEGVLTGRSMVISRDRIPAMQSLIKRLVQTTPFDVIHADQTSMAQYALYARHCQRQNNPVPNIILDQHNAMYLLVQRQARYERGWLRQTIWHMEAQRLKRYETFLCRQFDQILTVTDEDQKALIGLMPDLEVERLRNRLTALPICVDPLEQPMLPYRASDPRIIHLGTMFWPPNVEGVLWFAEQVLPLVLQQVPNACFTIAGKNPPPEILALTASDSPVAGHVEITGFVADPDPLLSSSRVFVVPLRAGGGMRVKIIDAWQWGIPLVSTTLGAEGIKTRSGHNIMLADHPEAFAAAVVQVLKDRELAEGLRGNGRSWVEQHYNWRTVYPRLNDVYSRLG